MFKVLIVDDEYFIRDGLEKIIQWDEYGIEVAGSSANGKEALEILESTHIDIVITDINMPEMNGIELLKVIRSSFSHIKVIIISGYNDFEFVKESLVYGVENYILKPINEDEISETLQNTVSRIEEEALNNSLDNANYIRENILCRLINNMISYNEVQERLSILQIDLDDENYVVGIVKIFSMSDTLELNDLKRDLLSLFNRKMDCSVKCQIFCDLSGNIVFLFSIADDESYSQIEEIMNQMIIYSNDELQIDLFPTLGSVENNLNEIHKSYANAEEIQKYEYLYPSNALLAFPDVILAREKLNYLYKLDTEELKDLLFSENKNDLEQFFTDLNEKIISGSMTLDNVRNLMVELTAGLISIIKQRKLWEDRTILNPDNLYNKLFDQKNIMSTLNWLKNISYKIIDEISMMKNKPMSLHDKMIEYIDTNISNNQICLKKIASEFSVNSSYLGQKFKNETGKLFSDYLNGKRIENAQDFLINSELNASEIAIKVGFSDANYFYKVFKKYTGVYPLDYKKEKQLNNGIQ
jgi:two-component system response regulator YesN